MNKNESKYFSTAVRMNEALLSLLDKKAFEYITVKEICDKAGVNRSTFYLHYENTSDLLRETTQYILDKHFAYYDVNKEDIAGRMSLAIGSEKPSELIFLSREYLLPYLSFVKENRRILKIAMKSFHLMNMDRVYEWMFKHIFEPILARFRVPDCERKYVLKFYINGVFAVISEWLSGDCAEDPELIVKVICDSALGERGLNG